MDYKAIYDRLINKARGRTLTDMYTESHHIVPRCLGGNHSEDNMVELTAREHFVAHLLLARIHGGGLWHVAHMMSNMHRYNSKDYAWLREKHAHEMSTALSGRIVRPESREKISKTLQQKTEVRKLTGMPHWHKGRKRTPEHIERQVASRKSGAGYVVSSEQRQKISAKLSGSNNPMWGKTHTPSSRRVISEANKEQVTCPHCSKQGGVAIMQRWHFDYCKNAPAHLVRPAYQKRTCPHCGKIGGGAQMTANHFDNCKKKY